MDQRNRTAWFDENDLPDPESKRALYEMAKALFLEAGYLEIALDHFALPQDKLAKAFKSKRLHRNFMGYTTNNTSLLIGLGMSAISDSWFAYAQNEKDLKKYLTRIERNEYAWEKGHLLSKEDLEIKQHIIALMCQFETTIALESNLEFEPIANQLSPMIEDGLVELNGRKVTVTERGKPFVRNVCMVFDPYLQVPVSKPTFSMTI